VPEVDQVFVLKHKRNWELGKAWSDQAPMALREIAKSVPGVADVTGYTNWFPLVAEVEGGLRKLRSLTVLPGLPRMLGLEAVQGDLEAALSKPDAIALTEAAALRLFGTANVLGQTMKVRLNASDMTVANLRIDAVVRTPPASTTIPFDSLNGLELTLLPKWAKEQALVGTTGYQGGYLLVRLSPGASVSEVTATLQTVSESSPLVARVPDSVKAHAGTDKFSVLRLAPLREAYMDDDISLNVYSTDVPRGDRRVVTGLTVIALLLLALAAINYTNLAIIRVIRRAREVALRKVLGVRRGRLALQFVAESMLVSLLATFLGVVLALLALPWFERLVSRDLSGMITAGNLLAAMALGACVGLLTAIYPAWVALRVRPALMLAGRGDGESMQGRRARQILTVLQLSLAMGLGGVTLAIAQQTRFAMTSSPGFDPANKLVLQLPHGMSAKWTPQADAFITEARQHPAIADIAVANTPVGENLGAWATDLQRDGGNMVFMEAKGISPNYFEMHGVAPAAGRLFQAADKEEPQQYLVMNAEAAKLAGFGSPQLAVGQTVKIRDMNMAMTDRTIIGIAPDIRFHSLRESAGPLMYLPISVGSTITVLARGSYADAELALRNLWPKYLPNAPFEARAARDIYAANYAEDAHLARMLAAATLIALCIAAGGAYVMAADAVLRRRREIAVRKLFGARSGHIGALVARELGILLACAGLIALPLSALAIARYLASFTERTPFAYLAPFAALVIAAAVITAAATRQAWLAMCLRPAVALRS
jgi:putative ABC transport system permease protein